jgi:hypothetical protein
MVVAWDEVILLSFITPLVLAIVSVEVDKLGSSSMMRLGRLSSICAWEWGVGGGTFIPGRTVALRVSNSKEDMVGIRERQSTIVPSENDVDLMLCISICSGADSGDS